MIEKAQVFIDEFYQLYPDRKIILLAQAGSHFFNLNSPNSDTDFKGIYMPSPKEFYEGESRRRFFDRKTGNDKSKNSSEDVDFSMFSYTFFLDLLAGGDFNSMELLFTPSDKVIIQTHEFSELVSLRSALIVNDVSAFLGFIKKEYKRYGVNIHHYKQQEDFYHFLIKKKPHSRLQDIWSEIQEYAKNNSFISFTESKTGNSKVVPSVKVAQRLYQNTVRVDYVTDALRTRLDTYGHRQKNNAASGVEYKGLYHALRLIYEANDIYDYGEMKIPFSKHRMSVLRSIKEGEIEQEKLFEMIDRKIEMLYFREQQVISNKKTVTAFAEKLKFKKTGQMALDYLVKRGSYHG